MPCWRKLFIRWSWSTTSKKFWPPSMVPAPRKRGPSPPWRQRGVSPRGGGAQRMQRGALYRGRRVPWYTHGTPRHAPSTEASRLDPREALPAFVSEKTGVGGGGVIEREDVRPRQLSLPCGAREAIGGRGCTHCS